MSARFDVVAVGNALVDVIGPVEEDFLSGQGIVKGSMSLVDEQRSASLFSSIPETIETSGGSAANTAFGVASLGGRAAFIGKVADDAFGRAFAHDLHRVGVEFLPVPTSDDESTGRCIIAVTPDGQRSMSTFLGASSLLDPHDISREAVQSAAVVFLEGYLFDRDHCEEDIGRPAWAVHRLGLSDADAKKNTMFFRTHKSVNAFFRRIRQNRSQS